MDEWMSRKLFLCKSDAVIPKSHDMQIEYLCLSQVSREKKSYSRTDVSPTVQNLHEFWRWAVESRVMKHYYNAIKLWFDIIIDQVSDFAFHDKLISFDKNFQSFIFPVVISSHFVAYKFNQSLLILYWVTFLGSIISHPLIIVLLHCNTRYASNSTS